MMIVRCMKTRCEKDMVLPMVGIIAKNSFQKSLIKEHFYTKSAVRAFLFLAESNRFIGLFSNFLKPRNKMSVTPALHDI